MSGFPETVGIARLPARRRLDKHCLPGIVAGEFASMPLTGIAMQAA